MLTPHQIAKLFVVSRGAASVAAGSADIESLIEQSLVRRVDAGPDGMVVQVTALGADLVARFANASPGAGRGENHKATLDCARTIA